MKIYPYIKSVVITVSLITWGVNAQSLVDFIGNWTGVENLESPLTTYENKSISQRLNEINSIARFLNNRTIEKISLTSLLLEKSERTIAKTRMVRNLFFL